MFTAPAVACEISAPPTTPRGTSRSSALGFTTFISRSLRVEPVVQPLLARAADAVVDRPRPAVVLRRLPRQARGALLAAGGPAALDQRVGRAGPARFGGHEQVVHQAHPARAERRPQPEDGREAD